MPKSAPTRPTVSVPIEDAVWVSTPTRHTPGHAPLYGQPVDGQRNVTTACGWRPLGGRFLTRQAARELNVMPCRSCFPTSTTPGT